MTSRALTLGGAIVFAIALGSASWWDARTVDAHPRISTTLTWHADIAPLFERQCASCHAAGVSTSGTSVNGTSVNGTSVNDSSATPTSSIPLATYADVRPWVRAVREEVLERRMPPRRGAPGVDAGVDDHPLSPMERDLIVGWIDGGSPEGKPDAERTATFWCRMHPEVRDERAGACPVCGMALAPFLPDLTRRYGWTIEPAVDARGRPRALMLSVTSRDGDSSTPTSVREFERVHDYPMHLFIVSEDFQRFQHVHPELDTQGHFSLAWVPPTPGRYWLYGDFLPVSGPPQLLQRLVSAGPSSRAPTRTTALVAAATGITARLAVSPLVATTGSAAMRSAPEGPRAGDAQRLAIELTETAGGKPVTDLEPYLGAWGHLFLVHEGHEEALHAHPETIGTTAGGPTIAFDVLFPRAGTYYLWAQVQRRHRIVTLPFRVLVVPRA